MAEGDTCNAGSNLQGVDVLSVQMEQFAICFQISDEPVGQRGQPWHTGARHNSSYVLEPRQWVLPEDLDVVDLFWTRQSKFLSYLVIESSGIPERWNSTRGADAAPDSMRMRELWLIRVATSSTALTTCVQTPFRSGASDKPT